MKRAAVLALGLLTSPLVSAGNITLKSVVDGDVPIHVMRGKPGISTDGGKTYTTLIGSEPVGEIHLKSPIPAADPPHGVVVVHCAKYEVLTGSTRQMTWAVGEDCEVKR